MIAFIETREYSKQDLKKGSRRHSRPQIAMMVNKLWKVRIFMGYLLALVRKKYDYSVKKILLLLLLLFGFRKKKFTFITIS